ncbi:ammonia-dependent NAD(+) synthetase [Achromobacter mucicolens]|uniref:ammonia-dependent NAD(+) synthetase n=1 Tax=Achromobacter mucicolens TaxID=1389922 RepID=UPI00244C41D0|nr:ammonia-dependent NAD(+) synthetase [Achromobacter mucicolens]MDH0091415.1 ammonia-dependent NAD(+) synthetase [Achromobacter mucicolens]
MQPENTSLRPQDAIARELGVTKDFDAAVELEARIAFLADYLTRAGRAGYVLGISGGVDSTVAARMAQLAVERVRSQGRPATFIAVRLPYGEQRDEDDAAQALDFIAPDRRMRIDIKPAVDAQREALRAAGLAYADAAAEDFGAGNIKARQRMIVQYAIAGALDCLVIGTDQAAEALMGFFTKHGDGAADVLPLRGLTKRRVRALGTLLGAPARLVQKVPTADLESLRPLRPDEDAYGVTYAQIDGYLEGEAIAPDAVAVIERQFNATAHKRALPPGPAS